MSRPVTIVADIDGPDGAVAGAVEIIDYEGGIGMAFRCPCGCGRDGYLPIRPPDDHGPSWEWNGDRQRPTLKPSIQQVGGCRWHGYLRNGVWEN